jgi:hypothetical protein
MSNSINNILNAIDKYYLKELKCNIKKLINEINIFKNPFDVWELLIGVAIKGKNRDANINVILEMEF